MVGMGVHRDRRNWDGDGVRAGLRVRERTRGGGWQGVSRWIGAHSLEIPLNHGLKFFERAGFNIKLAFEVQTHLSLHLVDLREGKCSLTNDTPGHQR